MMIESSIQTSLFLERMKGKKIEVTLGVNHYCISFHFVSCLVLLHDWTREHDSTVLALLRTRVEGCLFLFSYFSCGFMPHDKLKGRKKVGALFTSSLVFLSCSFSSGYHCLGSFLGRTR